MARKTNLRLSRKPEAGHRGIPSLILGGAWKTAGTASEGRISRGRLNDRRPSKSRTRSETPRQPACSETYPLGYEKCGLVLLLILISLTGCRVPANTPMLTARSLMNVELIIETEPRGAHVFAENFRFMGKAPVTQTWPLEKLTWSDGRTNFRVLPKGTRLEPGEKLSARLTVRAKGYKEKPIIVSISFSGKEETVTRKIVLEKK